MVVISLTKCPTGLRGDLSRWLIEISPGTYVGNVSARVRDLLWGRVCESVGNGQAVLVYNAHCEQGFKIETYHTNWELVDFDGISLIRKPYKSAGLDQESIKSNSASTPEEGPKVPSSDFPVIKDATQVQCSDNVDDYVVIDCETTGLSPGLDRIIEIAGIKVHQGIVIEKFERLIKQDKKVPQFITELTGITDIILDEKGCILHNVIFELKDFIGPLPLVGYNVKFDADFIVNEAKSVDIPMNHLKLIDVLKIVQRKLPYLPDKKQTTVAKHLEIGIDVTHRALNDCYVTMHIYELLKEK